MDIKQESEETLKLKIMVSAGEVSGDQRAAEVISHILNITDKVEIRGMGGVKLEELGVTLDVDSRLYGGLMGFTEVLTKLNGIVKSFKILKKILREWKPDILLVIDYPDFNLRLSKIADKLNIPVIYYIPPKVWAWRTWRCNQLKQYCREVYCIFPFEEKYLKQRGVSAKYVGHPFVQTFKGAKLSRAEICNKFDIDFNLPILLLMPGSRLNEISQHAHVINEAVTKLRVKGEKFSAIWALPSRFKTKDFIDIIQISPLDRIAEGDHQELMYHSTLGILKSGTCNLEAAFAGLPCVVVYKTSSLSSYIAKNIIKIKEVSLINIIKSGTVIELLQEHFTSNEIVAEVNNILKNSDYRNKIIQGYCDIRNSFTVYDYKKSPASIIVDRILNMTGKVI
jgi:lipid-A-disaccharide synthase